MSNAMSLNDQIATAEKTLDRLLEWVTRHDNKTLIVLGVETALLGVLVGSLPTPRTWTWWTTIVVLLALLSLCMSLACLFFGNLPQTKGPEGSLIYFRSIAKNTFDDYKKKFAGQSQQEYLEDLLAQCHRISEIVTRKFQALTWAYAFLVPGVIFWTFSLYLLGL